MKKQNLKSLSLNKKMISKLDDQSQLRINGGSDGPGSRLSALCTNFCTVGCGGTVDCPPKPSGGPCNQE